LVGAPECGDEAEFKTFGCGSAIASSSPPPSGQGQDREEALAIKDTNIVREFSVPLCNPARCKKILQNWGRLHLVGSPVFSWIIQGEPCSSRSLSLPEALATTVGRTSCPSNEKRCEDGGMKDDRYQSSNPDATSSCAQCCESMDHVDAEEIPNAETIIRELSLSRMHIVSGRCDSSFDTYRPSFRVFTAFFVEGMTFRPNGRCKSLREAQRTARAGFSWMIHEKTGLPTRCSLPPILEYLLHRAGCTGNAELTDDIRVLDGQRFSRSCPWTHLVASEELAIAEPQPNVLNSASSPHSGAPTKPVPTLGSSSGRPPTLHG